MYSQVQVPIPIHGKTTECVIKINFAFLYFSLITLKKTISWLRLRDTADTGNKKL